MSPDSQSRYYYRVLGLLGQLLARLRGLFGGSPFTEKEKDALVDVLTPPSGSESRSPRPDAAEYASPDAAEVQSAPPDDGVSQCASPDAAEVQSATPDYGAAEPTTPELASKVRELERQLIAQEHRLFSLLYNALKYTVEVPKDADERAALGEKRLAAYTALVWRFFAPRTAVVAGGGLIAAVGLVLAWQANLYLRDQNVLVQRQNESLIAQIQQDADQDYLAKKADLIRTIYGRTECAPDERICSNGGELRFPSPDDLLSSRSYSEHIRYCHDRITAVGVGIRHDRYQISDRLPECPLRESVRARYEAVLAYKALQEARGERVVLDGADFADMDFVNVKFVNVSMRDVVLYETVFQDVQFVDSYLSASAPELTFFYNVQFRHGGLHLSKADVCEYRNLSLYDVGFHLDGGIYVGLVARLSTGSLLLTPGSEILDFTSSDVDFLEGGETTYVTCWDAEEVNDPADCTDSGGDWGNLLRACGVLAPPHYAW